METRISKNERIVEVLNKTCGLILILLSITVSIPLTIKVYLANGGPWGFGIVALPVLLPLSCYLFFGIAGMIRKDTIQRKMFIGTHVISLGVGFILLLIFTFYPKEWIVIPVILAILGVINKSSYKYYLFFMIVFGIVANATLLKWELDFHRSIPIIQLIEPDQPTDP